MYIYIYIYIYERLQYKLILCARTQTIPLLRIRFKIKHTLNSELINLQCIKHSYYHLWVVCVDLWSVIYFIFHPTLPSFPAFPIHRSASFTLEWLFVGLGLFYMQEGLARSGWLWRIFLLVTKLHIERVAFFYTTTLLLLDDMVDTLKKPHSL